MEVRIVVDGIWGLKVDETVRKELNRLLIGQEQSERLKEVVTLGLGQNSRLGAKKCLLPVAFEDLSVVESGGMEIDGVEKARARSSRADALFGKNFDTTAIWIKSWHFHFLDGFLSLSTH